MQQGHNVLFRGPAGVGKTSLAQNLGLHALQRGFTVRFCTLAAALADLLKYDSLPRFEHRLAHYTKPQLLICDEIGYLPCDQRSADILYNIITRRLLAQQTGIRVTPMTMYRYLARAGIHRQCQQPATPAPGSFNVGPEVPSEAPAEPPLGGRYGYTPAHRDPGPPAGYPSSLTDSEWALVADLFQRHGPGKPPKYPRRLILDACCYVLRSGCQWRMLPKDFPPWQDVYAHFRRWTDKGLLERMQDRLRALERQRQGRAPQPTAAVLDSQSIKTSPQGGPKGFDMAKKVKGRKRHLVVDVLGLVLAVLLLPADIQDRDGAAPVVKAAMDKCPGLKKLYVDGAYGGDCAQQLREQYHLDVEVVRRPGPAGSWTQAGQPPPAPASCAPFPILPRRWVVERTHAWVERPRRLSKDYDRRLDVSTAWVWFSQARLLLRRLAHAGFA